MNLDYITQRARHMSDTEIALELLNLERESTKLRTAPGLRLCRVKVSVLDEELKRRRLEVAPVVPVNRQARWLPNAKDILP